MGREGSNISKASGGVQRQSDDEKKNEPRPLRNETGLVERKRRIRGFIGRASDWRKTKGSSKLSTSSSKARMKETNRKFAVKSDEEFGAQNAHET